MLNHRVHFPSQNPDLRLEGRTLLSTRVDRLGRRCRSNLSMSFLVHAGPSNTPPRRGPCSNTMLKDRTHFLSQNPGLGLEGRGLLARVDQMGQRRETNLIMPFCVPTGPSDTQSRAVFQSTDEDLETEESMWNLYERWQRYHNVSLDPNEKQRRFKAFMDKARYIHEFNKRNDTTYTLCLNKFADLTSAEFSSRYKGLGVWPRQPRQPKQRDPWSPAPSSTKD